MASRILAAALVASSFTDAAISDPPLTRGFGPGQDVAKSRGPQVFNAINNASKQLQDTILTPLGTQISQPWPMAQRPHPVSGFETGHGHIVAQYSLYLWKTLSLEL